MAEYYTPSGKTDPKAYLFLVLTIVIILPLLALIYAYAIWYIPIIYVNFFITAGLGIGTGFVIRKLIVVQGKVRNTKIAILFAVIASLFVWYFQWVITVDLLINISDIMGNSRMGVAVSNIDINQTISIVGQPGLVFDVMGELYKGGSWGIFGFTMAGVPLAIVWVLEFLVIVVIAVSLVVSDTKKPFCELTNSWFKEQVIGPFTYVLDRPSLLSNLEMSSRTSFDNLEFSGNNQRDHTLFYLYSNDSVNYLTGESHKAKMSDGKLEFDVSPFVITIAITEEMKLNLLKKATTTPLISDSTN